MGSPEPKVRDCVPGTGVRIRRCVLFRCNSAVSREPVPNGKRGYVSSASAACSRIERELRCEPTLPAGG
jgi:hypothetical protein